MKLSRLFAMLPKLCKKIFFGRSSIKNKMRKLKPVNYVGFLLVLLLIYIFGFKSQPPENFINFIKINAFQPNFSGATACGNFPCFGSTLCNIKTHKLISIYSNGIIGVDEWLKIGGVIKSHHRVENNVTLTFPLFQACDKPQCSVRLNRDLFSIRNYQTWLCNTFGVKGHCNIKQVLHDWPPMRKLLLDSGRLNPEIIRGLSPPLQCASSRIADRLLRFVLGSRGKGSTNLNDYTYSEKAQLILISKTNPEFVIQRMFPFNEFHLNEAIGVCGLMTLHKRGIDPSLFDFYHAPWYVRVDVAVQLLDLAHYYSENDYNYLLLMHKLTPYDVTLTEDKEIKIRNGNNLVIVDKSSPSRGFSAKAYEVPYTGMHINIPEKNICRHNETDINFYSVCRYFLTGPWKGPNGEVLEGGLLHHPKGLSLFQSKLSFLLDVCVRGSIAVPKDQQLGFQFSVRKAAAGHLRLLLRTARVCSPEFKYRFPECELFEKSYDLSNLRFYRLPNNDIKWLR